MKITSTGRQRWVSWMLVQAGRALIASLFFLNRVTVRGEEHILRARAGGQPIFVGFWHGRMLYVLRYLRRFRPTVLASPSRDGMRMAHILRSWGYRIIWGSSSKGGREARQRMMLAFDKPETILVIAVDGPVGPARTAKPGGLALAAKKEAVLIPMSGAASRHWTFEQSWDRLQLPKPFGRIVIQFGEPIEVEPGIKEKELAHLMGQQINQAENEADALAARLG